MSNYIDILKQYAFGTPTPTTAAPVNTQQSDDTYYKIAAARQNGSGAEIIDPLQRDLLDLTTSEILAKYGVDGIGMIQQRAQGESRYTRDRYDPTANTLFDTGTAVAGGFAGTVGGLASLAAGGVNDRAGAWIAEKVGDFNGWVEGNQSDGLTAHRRANRVATAIEYDDNTAKYERERQTDGDLIAGFRRVGRDAISAVSNAVVDGAIATDGTANAVGSLLVGGPLGKGARIAGAGLTGKLLSRGVISEAAAIKAGQVGSKLAMPATIGAMESGGAYQQTTNEVMGMSHEQLLAGSPDYAQLIQEGWNPEDAKVEVATSAGLAAAAITFPVAAAAGTLVSKFEANPFKGALSGLGVVKNGASEAIEEAIQSGTGGFAGNVGIQNYADESRDLTEGVGEQAGLGALYGFGSAGVVQAPGAAANLAIAGTKAAIGGTVAAGKAVAQPFVDRFNTVTAERAAASPVSPESLTERTNNTINSNPELTRQIDLLDRDGTLQPEQVDLIRQKFNTLDQTIRFDRAQLDEMGVSPVVKESLADSTSQFEALSTASLLATTETVAPRSRIDYALYVNDVMTKLGTQMTTDLIGAFEAIPDGHASQPLLEEYQDTVIAYSENPEIQNAIQIAKDYVQKLKAKDVTAENVATPSGQQAVKAIASVAESSPEAVTGELADVVLEHARKGIIRLSPSQLRAVSGSSLLANVSKSFEAKAKTLEIKPIDVVNGQILHDASGDTTREKSAAAHMKFIMDAVRANDIGTASERMNRMMQFAQHMQNKVNGLNKAYLEGNTSSNNPVIFEALTPNGKWLPSVKGVYISPVKANSIGLAQKVSLEAQALGEMANELALLMPELNVSPVEIAELHPDLIGPADKLAKQFEAGTRKAKPAPVVTQEAKPAPTPEPTAVAVAEPAKVEPAQAEPSTVQAESKAPTAAVETETKPEPIQEEAKPVEGPEEKLPPAEVSTTQPETEAAPEQPAKVEPAAEAITDEPASIRKVFEYLFESENGKVKNAFFDTFKLPKEARSRLIGTESPAIAVFEALASNKALASFRGAKTNKTLSSDLAKDYQAYIAKGNAVLESMQRGLADFLDTVQNKKSNITFYDALLNGLDEDNQVNAYPRGKGLNIVELNDKDQFSYNQELVEGAMLAGLQWALSAQSKGRNFDAEDLARTLGIDETEAAMHVAWFNQGTWTTSAKRDLSSLIPKYWGLQMDRNAPEGYAKGISESIAAEVLKGLVAAGILTQNERQIGFKKYTQYVFNPENADLFKSLSRFPSAIEEAVLVEPENINHIGTAPAKVADTQLHGSPVPLKAKVVEALEAAQNTPHGLNLTMLRFAEMLDDAGIEGLFGRGTRTGTGVNANTAKSIEGYNRTVTSAWENLRNLVGEMQNYGDTNGVNLEDVKMFFEYGISSVGRMQAQGRANGQSSKLVREILLPTWSTLDLTDRTGDHYKAFMLAMAQHLKIDVHKISQKAAIEQIEEELGSKFLNLIDTLEDWSNRYDGKNPLALTETDFAPFKQVLGDKTAPAAIHALTEYARYMKASPAERAAFKTALYLEADGVTDGPINALVNLTAGSFKPSWIDLVNRGGLYLGKAARSLADYIGQKEAPFGNGVKDTTEDLYKLSTKFLDLAMAALKGALSTKQSYLNINDAMLRVMSDLLPDMKFNPETGELKFERGIAKNPLTVTVYGSGVRGIANKITALMLEELYSKYPTEADLSPKMRQDIKFLSTFVINKSKFGYFMKSMKDETNLEVKDGLEFTLSSSMIKNIEANVKTLFAQPMADAIGEVMGDAMQTATVLRQATQAQSIFFKYAYKQAIADAVAQKGTKSGEFLSQAELKDIFQKLVKKFPMIETNSQTIWVGGSSQADVTTTQFGSALDETLRTDGYVYGPENSGVSGIPFIVIATGDGQMILNALTGEDAPQGTLAVFDGINMKLDSIFTDSVKINKAVYDGWLENPVRAVEKSYRSFVEQNLDMRIGDLSYDFHKELYKVFEYIDEDTDDGSWTQTDPLPWVTDTHASLSRIADQLDARKAVMAKLNMSVDHMASAASPFVKTDGVELPADPVAAAEIMNTMLAEEMAKMPEAKPLNIYKAPSEDITEFLGSIGEVHPSGAKVIGREQLRDMVDKLNIPLDQKGLFRASVNSLATQGYTVLFGEPAQLQNYAEAQGIKLPYGFEGNNGLALPGDKTIFLMSANSETLTHEMIHAATMNQVFAHYAGQTVHKDIPGAIARMEKLMEEFMGLDTNTIKDTETRTEFLFAKAQIDKIWERTDSGRAVQKASALNEFMAWTLANQKLADLARATTVQSKLGLIVKSVMDTLRKLWRAGLAPTAQDDVYSNLRFNTLVLMQAKSKSVLSPANRIALPQASKYGNSDRLANVETMFVERMQGMIQAAEAIGPKVGAQVTSEHVKMNEVARKVTLSFRANGFNMTPQESSLFHTLLAAFALDKSLDANALSRVQDVYKHVLSTLKVEDFMADPDSQDPAARYNAQQKYDLIVGNYFVGQDLDGRTTLLPAFLALSVVSDEFREVLNKLPVPKNQKLESKTLDAFLYNSAVEGMDRLAKAMSGEGTKNGNVLSAMNLLIDRIAQADTDRELYIEQFSNPVGNGVDRLNQWMVDSGQRLSQEAADKLSDIRENTNSKAVKLAANVAEAALAIINPDISEKLANGTISLLNKGDVPVILRELVSEVVGRTNENAPIFDMIKKSRALIQQLRQIFRERLPAIINEKFTRPLKKEEAENLYLMAKTDIAALAPLGSTAVLEILRDGAKLKQAVANLETEIGQIDPAHTAKILLKSRELATYMNTGKASSFLLKNAEAIANLFGELPPGMRKARGAPSSALIKAVDQLVSLYALSALPTTTRASLATLAASEVAGMEFTLAYLKGQRSNELNKSYTVRARLNHYKGYVPTETRSGSSLIVASDKDYVDLTTRGYTRVGNYKGSSAERGMAQMGYYFAPLSGKSPYNQGIAQNIRHTFSGVDPLTGFSIDMYGAGRITDQAKVRAILSQRSKNGNQKEALIPVLDADGDVVGFERTLDPVQLEKLEKEKNLPKVLGIWRGRQEEEGMADEFNRQLVRRLHDMWGKAEFGRKNEFVNLLDPKSHKDPVITDAVKLLSPAMLRDIEDVFGNEGFMVRKDMINDTVGYRSPSIGDLWTGVTRISPDTAKIAANIATAIIGPKAYQYLVTGEKLWQNFVSDARTTIVVRSVIVPAANIVSNVYQLAARGVPLKDIARGMPKKLAEVHAYHQSHLEEVKLEAEILAAGNNTAKLRPLRAKLQSIKDDHKRLSIWPLIQAGEFSSVSEATVMRDESTLFEGKVSQYIEGLVDKMPASLRTAGKYAIISRDTALFQGLQRTVEYGDFLAKAVLYDDLTKRKSMSKDEALATIGEEYVNYDRLPGRFRGSLESMGLLWFYHFKLRSIKVAMSMIRNNPLHTLMVGLIPAPSFLGSVGLPVTDNALAIAAEGKLGWSVGPMMGVHAHAMNPWANGLL